jgi:hypothetical protein
MNKPPIRTGLLCAISSTFDIGGGEMHQNDEGNSCCAINFRLGNPLFDQVEDWRRSQTLIPTRSEAVRLLIERGLVVSSEFMRELSGPRPAY